MSAKKRTMRAGRRKVEISNPDKLLFPDDGITKADLADYYLRVSDAMLPEVRERLITMERFPDGIGGEQFYQKSISKYFPDWIDRKTVPKKGGKVTHVVANSSAALVYLANQAAITLHMSLSRIDKVTYPDQLVLDLDPSTDDFALVRRSALFVRDVLEDLGLASVVKTSGSRGLHVTVPLRRTATFDEGRSFAHEVAGFIASQRPDELTIEGRKGKRGDRLYVDWLRNSTSATVVAPYSVRARAGAPVAMPLEWAEVEDRKLTPHRYTMKDALAEVDSGRDPWKGWRRRAGSVTGPARKLKRLVF